MFEAKPWWQSKGVIGGLISLIAPLAAMAGFTLDTSAQSALTDLTLQGVSLLGGVFSIYGRIAATRRVA